MPPVLVLISCLVLLLLPAPHPQAVFDGGDYCHKAPPRSLRVKIECGSEEKAWDASEPEVRTLSALK